MLHKKWPRDDYRNYRAIWLLCHSSKLMSTIMARRMMTTLRRMMTRARHVCNASHEMAKGRLQELPSNLTPVSLLQVDVCYRGTAYDDYTGGPPTWYTGRVQTGTGLPWQRLRLYVVYTDDSSGRQTCSNILYRLQCGLRGFDTESQMFMDETLGEAGVDANVRRIDVRVRGWRRARRCGCCDSDCQSERIGCRLPHWCLLRTSPTQRSLKIHAAHWFQWRIQSWSQGGGGSKSHKFKWLVNVGASKGVIRVD